MQKEVTIKGTQEGFYLGCIDEEKSLYECLDDCPICPHPCRVLLEKEQPIDKERRVLAEIDVPLFLQKDKLIASVVGVYLAIFVFMLVFRKYVLPYYRSLLPVFFSGFFGAAAFYLLLKLLHEKRGGDKAVLKGRIIRVFPADR